MSKLEDLVPPLELWKNIPGWDGYQASTTGKVRSVNYNRMGICRELRQYINKTGYFTVALTKHGKTRGKLVHRLVAETFLLKMPTQNEVDHIDTNTRNNHVENLRWCTSGENKMNPITRRRNSENNHWKGKTGILMHNSKPVMCVETGMSYGSMTEAERETGISHENISACCRKKCKSAGGKHWELIPATAALRLWLEVNGGER